MTPFRCVRCTTIISRRHPHHVYRPTRVFCPGCRPKARPLFTGDRAATTQYLATPEPTKDPMR